MNNHIDAALCERLFDVTGQESPSLVLLLQHRIHVAKREPAHKEVSLLA